jgi:hypothetical protein
MTHHLRYAQYILRHKLYVLLAGTKTGAPLWRLLIHDWSKLLPCEWSPYATWFYAPEPIASYGGLSPYEVEAIKSGRVIRFKLAWLHHLNANPHHWQHWVLRNDDGTTEALQIPEWFVREMVADWAGAGRAITGRWEVAQWYRMNRERMILHPDTRTMVESIIAEVFEEARG